MTLKEILELENIRIDEDCDNVFECGEIDFTNIDSDGFYARNYDIKKYIRKYKFSETSYSIYKNDEIIACGLSVEEVTEFLEKLEEKYKN
jgi:hypothetical protein